MELRVKNIILILIFCFFSLGSYAQTKTPPAPMMTKQSSPPDCGDTGTGGGGINVPPPPGLCLPIDDYVIYLLIAGAIYGAYRTNRIHRA